MLVLTVRRLAPVLIAMSCALMPLFAQSQPSRARIALYELSGQRADTALSAALGTVADSVELDLVCLQRYEVRRLAAVDPARDLEKVRSYCRSNRIDQAILGSGRANPEGGYAFKLVLYDRQTDSIKLEREGTSSSALDMFDTTDELVAALLDSMSGQHLLFGALTVETEPAGAMVSVNGMEVGPSPVSLRGLPVGTVVVSARSAGWEDASSSVRVQDEQTASATLRMERSRGRLVLNMPDDAYVTLRAPEIGEKILWSYSAEEIPTGTYQLEASCPGLASVTGTVDIRRLATSRWTPWARAYLDVRPELEGARLLIDGTEKGTAPMVVDVDPGVMHRVELRKDKYELYRADLTVVAARKVSFEPVLTAKPGSVRVETTPAGMMVRLDDSESQATPCTFEAVEAGTHTLKTSELLVDRRFFVGPGSVSVDVNPDEQTVVRPEVVAGTAFLAVTGAPPHSVVTADGVPVDAATVFADGAQVPAGNYEVVVTSPQGQQWKTAVRAGNGMTARRTVDEMVAVVPRRSIKVDGKTDDWAGLEPFWLSANERGEGYWFQWPSSRTDPFPHQPGTRLARGWVCRDDHDIYVRMDFDNGTPGTDLSSDIQGSLMRELQCGVAGGRTLIFQLGSSRQWGVWAKVSIWDPASKTSSDVAELSAYKMAGSTFEFAVPLSRVREYLSNPPYMVFLDVVDAGQAKWNSGYSTYKRSLDFDLAGDGSTAPASRQRTR